MRVIGVYREAVYSPGKVAADAAILGSALKELSHRGVETSAVYPEDLTNGRPSADLVLSMAQSDGSLQKQELWQKSGLRIMNTARSVRNCYRKPMIELLTTGSAPVPSSQIVSIDEVEHRIGARPYEFPCWLKRGDVHAIESGDVVKIASADETGRALDHFQKRGIGELLVQEHVDGLAVKFYGVGAGEYFKAFLSSSAEEVTSGTSGLMQMAMRSAATLGLEIYGGDAILTEGGRIVLVDLNDWPSFSLCRRSAAKSIARYVLRASQPG